MRLDVLTSLLVHRVKHEDESEDVYHLRFPENRITKYFQRKGNPPSDTDRNPWERGLRLELDIGQIDATARRAVKDLLNLHNDDSLSEDAYKQVRTWLLLLVAKKLKNIMGAEFKGTPATAQDLIDMEAYEQAALKLRMQNELDKGSKRITAFKRFPQFAHHDRTKYRN